METSFSQTDVMDVAWSPHDAWLASCSVDNTVVIWNAVKFPGESSKDVPVCEALCQSSLLGCISPTLQIPRRECVVCLCRCHTCSLAGQSFFQVWMAMSRGFHTAADNSCIQAVLLILHESHDCMCLFTCHLFEAGFQY